MSRKIKDLTGQRFGRLTVIEFTELRNSQARWLCRCDCGSLKEIHSGNLTSGNTTSCGCYKREVGDCTRRPEGESNRNDVYSSYRQQAQRRDLSFDLTINQAEAFFKGDCYYCGVKPSNIRNDKASNGAYIYNGIDRVDNNLGYTIDNCVACCIDCNRSKSNATSNIILRAARFLLSKANK